MTGAGSTTHSKTPAEKGMEEKDREAEKAMEEKRTEKLRKRWRREGQRS